MVNNCSNSTSVWEILHYIHHRKIGFELRLHPVLPVPDLNMKNIVLNCNNGWSAMLLVTQYCYCETSFFIDREFCATAKIEMETYPYQRNKHQMKNAYKRQPDGNKCPRERKKQPQKQKNPCKQCMKTKCSKSEWDISWETARTLLTGSGTANTQET